MAGFFIVFGSYESMLDSMRNGVYAAQVNEGKNGPYAPTAEATLADYASMRPGDSLYFFSNRQVYGRGRLVDVEGCCRRQNFPRASELKSARYDRTMSKALLWDSGPQGWTRWSPRQRKNIPCAQRWVCTFEPDPSYWSVGVDMDDLLDSNPPAFRVVRSMANATFVKIDDEEERAFLTVLARANAGVAATLVDFDNKAHRRLSGSCRKQDYGFGIDDLLSGVSKGKVLRHEMAVEAALVRQIADREPQTESVLGSWDYVSRQVPASPQKPAVWMDAMDLFGYSYLPGYDNEIIGHYFVGEVKKDAAKPEEVEQVMRYVDWVKDQYADRDYSLVTAFLIASGFPDAVRERAREAGRRLYTVRRRPAQTSEWDGLRLVKYTYATGSDSLSLEVVPTEDSCDT